MSDTFCDQEPDELLRRHVCVAFEAPGRVVLKACDDELDTLVRMNQWTTRSVTGSRTSCSEGIQGLTLCSRRI